MASWQAPATAATSWIGWHRKVNIGLAWDRYNFSLVQHFEGDYVQYDRLPEIANGVLRLSGTTRNGVTFRSDEDLGVQIYFDPSPRALTPGQVSRTYCYDQGRLIGALRPPLSGDWYYDEDGFDLKPPAVSRSLRRMP